MGVNMNKNRFWTATLVIVIIIAVTVGIWVSYSVGYRRGEADDAVTANRAIKSRSVTATEEMTEPDADRQTETVYWVSGGKVWHTTQYCRALARSTNIHKGSIAGSGKARACKVCG
jgi:hypothetical protein